jgi:hypothetical protein
MAAAVHGGQLFVFGWYTGGTTVTDEVLLYDSEGDRWEAVGLSSLSPGAKYAWRQIWTAGSSWSGVVLGMPLPTADLQCG